MIGFLKNLFVGGIGSTVSAVGNTVAKFTGDKVQQESNQHTEAMAVHAAYSSENSQLRQNRTWWDSLWDGLNRAPRPLMALGVMGLLVWPIFDPVRFSSAMAAYALVPEWHAAVFIAIAGFYFTTRHLEKVKLGKGPSADQVKAILDTQDRIRDLGKKEITQDQFKSEMDDESKPLSDEAIEHWNKISKSSS
tara:strand:- start:117 stop:692 length:576 start_codon:yes stop_codon:yes gene_type:complete